MDSTKFDFNFSAQYLRCKCFRFPYILIDACYFDLSQIFLLSYFLDFGNRMNTLFIP